MLFLTPKFFQETDQDEELDESIKQRRFTYSEKRKEIGEYFPENLLLERFDVILTLVPTFRNIQLTVSTNTSF